MPGPPPRGDRAATPAERSAAYRARRKATVAAAPAKPPVVVRYRRPADRRSRPEQWADAVQILADLLDQFQEWRDIRERAMAAGVGVDLGAVQRHCAQLQNPHRTGHAEHPHEQP